MEENKDKTFIFKILIGILSWILLFGWTVNIGFSHNFLGSFLSFSNELIVGSLLNIVLLIAFFIVYKKWTKEMFSIKNRKYLILYGILLIAAVLVPFHYTLDGPFYIYIFFITVSVIWQNYITFGILQRFLRQWLPYTLTLVILFVLFIGGNILFVSNFLDNIINIIFIAILVPVFSFIMEKTGKIHLLIFIHLLFYFINC